MSVVGGLNGATTITARHLICNIIYKFYKFMICTINKNVKLYIVFGIIRHFGAMRIFLDMILWLYSC
jgi:hypothetical protein